MTGHGEPKHGPIREAALSYWTVGIVALIVIAGHIRWFTRGGPTAEVISGFGAAFVVLGIWVAARPFLRMGVRAMAEQSVQGTAPQAIGWDVPPPEAGVAYQARIDAAMPDVWAERVIAVLVIVVGTLLNGYGGVIARGLHHLCLLHARNVGHG